MTPLAAILILGLVAPEDPADGAARDLMILGETRPILLRIRVKIGDRPFGDAWKEATRGLLLGLDRDKDGKVTIDEAEKGGLAASLGPAPANGQAKPVAGLDANKDGAISEDELAEALRAAASGPFRLAVEGLTDRRTDALFDHLDRDKDGELSRPEMEAIIGSLHRLDRNADELIDAGEIEIVAPPAASMAGRPSSDPGVPAVLELGPEESPARLTRVLIKKYDVGSSRGPGRRDSKLSAEEFAIGESAFASADANKDGLLTADELRTYLEKAPRDAIIDVSLSPDASGHASARVRGGDGGPPPAGMTVRQLGEEAVEIDLGTIRLDLIADDGAGALEAARKGFQERFKAADSDANGYLEPDEVGVGDNGLPSPFAGLFKSLDRDDDNKVYHNEIDDFLAQQAAAARGRVIMTASNEGRALFGMLDLDRDRRLGAREVLETFARLSACDRDTNGRVTPEEIPHHIALTLTRGDLSALLMAPLPNGVVAANNARTLPTPRPTRPAAGPTWFRKMDRNRDGDVSRREFLGTREQFARLDTDHDGLIGPAEADAATKDKADPPKP